MFRNQLIYSIRLLKRHPLYVAVSLLSLTISITCSSFIYLFVENETGYDQHHSNAYDIYRVVLDMRTTSFEEESIAIGHPMGPLFQHSIPEVEAAVRVWNDYSRHMAVSSEEQSFLENHVYYTDTTFAQIFDLTLIKGSIEEWKSNPRALLITPEIAQKYFNDQDPIGQRFNIKSSESEGDHVVVGIVERFPTKSHFHFDFLARFEAIDIYWMPKWMPHVPITYLKLAPDADITKVQAIMQQLLEQTVKPRFKQVFALDYDEFVAQGYRYSMFLQPLTDIHLYSNREYELEANGSIAYNRLLILMGVLILLVAVFNYLNLATGRATMRVKAIGIRKILGSSKSSLIAGFVYETIWIAVLAWIVAVAVVVLFLEPFNHLVGKSFELTSVLNVQYLSATLLCTLFTGILAGLYPSIFLSRQSIMTAVKGSLPPARMAFFRNLMIGIQFGISIFLIIGSLIIYQQLEYFQSKSLGFDREQLLVVDKSLARDEQLRKFSQDISSLSGVKNVALTSKVPSLKRLSTSFRKRQTDQEEIQLAIMKVDDNYLETLGIELITGRNFNDQTNADSMAVILNKVAAVQFGIADNPIGQTIYGWLPHPMKVIGIVEDFHISSFHNQLMPMALLSTHLPYFIPILDHVVVRVDTNNPGSIITQMESSWKQHIPDRPIVYSFMDDRIERLYNKEHQLGQLVTLITGIALLIACLGLFGLINFLTTARLREVAIRKVHGAHAQHISWIFIKLVLPPLFISGVLSITGSLTAGKLWLEQFAYRMEPSVGLVISAVVLLMVVVLCTLFYNLWKVSTVNPVSILKED